MSGEGDGAIEEGSADDEAELTGSNKRILGGA
jgi:hypothetical protein